MTWSAALLAATALHAGFQLTVSLVVYPGLVATPGADWSAGHAAHSRRIAPLVGLVYAGLLVTGAGALLTAPTPATLVAVAAAAGAMAVTAVLAAPLHGGLGEGRDERRLRRLVRVDRVRTLLALVAAAAALLT